MRRTGARRAQVGPTREAEARQVSFANMLLLALANYGLARACRNYRWCPQPSAALAPFHICAGTGLNPPTSAPGPGSPLPHLRRDQAHPSPILRRDRARPSHICAGTGLLLSADR